MLIKEYRIPMPQSVDEYRIAQLYMILKKSREETNSSGSGVEIVKNEPYTNGPGGNGQYTFKIYHIERHLPGWFKAILPETAMLIEEEAWNAYPYTKTRYRCPFIDRFSLEIETCYQADFGTEENIFNLKRSDLEHRTVEFIDIVQSQPLPETPAENPSLFRSEKTGRGPLASDWFAQMKRADQRDSIMCAYKLCRIEFRYWGMQSRCERYIHEMALRRTILRAHRQAWCWQDEYQDLTLADIRRLEYETQQELNQRMALFKNENLRLSIPFDDNTKENVIVENNTKKEMSPPIKTRPSRQLSVENTNVPRPRINLFPVPPLPKDEVSDDEYFDAKSFDESASNVCTSVCKTNPIEHIHFNKLLNSNFNHANTDDDKQLSLPSTSDDNNHSRDDTQNKCVIEILILVFYGGNIFSNEDALVSAKNTDFVSFCSTFHGVLKSHYSRFEGKIAMRFVECRSICIDTINFLNSLSPYGAFKMACDMPQSEILPINAIPLFATANSTYQKLLTDTVISANQVYREFLMSKEGKNFSGQVVIIGDANGAILAYDALCLNQDLDDAASLYSEDPPTPHVSIDGKRTRKDTHDTNSMESLDTSVRNVALFNNGETTDNSDSLRSRREKSSTALAFIVNEFFSFGSPLSLILAYRQIMTDCVVRPYCGQLYNLFHICDPNAFRIEPLIRAEFNQIPPCCIPRYSQFPLGDGESTLLIECVYQHSNLFATYNNSTTQLSSDVNTLFSDLQQTWWGSRRVDHIVYAPESLVDQSVHVLPIVLYSSYWESRDVASFILRNITRNQDQLDLFSSHADKNPNSLSVIKAIEHWLHRSTAVKIRNLAPNHRAVDIIVVEGRPQTIRARFHYGPIDMVCLVHEIIDIYVMRSSPYGEWILLDTVKTDTHGRIRYILPDDRRLPIGLHSVKLVVRGDHTSADLSIAILPSKSEAVIFSIDGSLTSSFSVSHNDPKVRPGAIDVVRYWQELGYIIIYVTARPDIQQRQIVRWLAQHNFPHGITLFNNGIYREPIKHKSELLRNLVENADLVIAAAYGSSKDASGYRLINVPPEKLFVVGKYKSRLQGHVHFLTNGYAMHLSEFSQPGMVRPAKSNSRHLVRRTCLNFSTSLIISSTLTTSSSSPSPHTSTVLPKVSRSALDQTLSQPITYRNVNSSDHVSDSPSKNRLLRNISQAKDFFVRGTSPRMHQSKTPMKDNQDLSLVERL